jgi:hypothetical protein
MKATTRSQIVMTGPRPIVSELVMALESEELGRKPGSPPLPTDSEPSQQTLSSDRQLEPVWSAAPEQAIVVGPTLATTEAGFLEVRYAVEAIGSSAQAVKELAKRLPEIVVVLTEQRQADKTELSVFRGGRRIAMVDCACNGLLVLPARQYLTLQDCILQANGHTMVTGSLLAFAVLDDVRGNGTLRHDAGAWTATTIDCTDGSKLTLAHPDPEAWTAQMVLTNAKAVGALLEYPNSECSPLDELPSVFDYLLPHALVGRDTRQLKDITALALAWASGRPLDDEIDEAADHLCRRLPARAVAEAAIGSDEETPAKDEVEKVLSRLGVRAPALRLLGGQS